MMTTASVRVRLYRTLPALLIAWALLPLPAVALQGRPGDDAERELQPKVEVILGPGTVVFIAAVLQGEEAADQEMLPVRYDARFQKVRVDCEEDRTGGDGCRDTRLDVIGFPKHYETEELPCSEPMVLETVRFGGEELEPTEAPRRSRKKRSTAWFHAGRSVENGATILAAYRCPAPPVGATAEAPP